VVLTGGAAKVPGLVDMAREKLKLPVQIGIPQGFEGLTDKVEDTSYSTALGLLIWASRYQGQGVNMNFDLSKIDFSRVTDTFKSWFKNLMP
jgi:cell division protein FtsA